MDQLKLQVAKARRRLVTQQFLSVLVWCWFATLLAAAIAIGVQKKWLVDIDGATWAAAWLGGAFAAGLLAAIVWTWLVRLPELDAAIEIDRRFGLKERVSSTLALTPDELQTPFGQALVEDAHRRISRLDVESRFPVSLRRGAWLPALPATIAFALCFLADPTRPSQAGANATPLAVAKQIKESIQTLPKQLEQRRQEAGEKGLKEAEDLFKKLEDRTRDLMKKDESDRSTALAKLNDLTKDLEQRRDKLADGEKLKQQLAAMKNLPTGPADRLAQDLKNGKFDKALEELEKLKVQMAQGKLDPQQQKELADQLKAMKDAMEKMADAHKKAHEELQRQLDQAKKNGDQQAAKNLQEQLNKLQQQQPQMDQLRKLGDQLGQIGQQMEAGNADEAQAALNQLANELAQMQAQAAEIQMMEAALNEIAGAKAAMNCGQCQGAGCAACQGMQGQPGIADFAQGRGDGGAGKRAESPHDTKFYDSKVQQNVGKGSAVVTGLIDGPNAKGKAVEEIKGQVEAARHEAADPLTGQRLPRQQRDHVQQYFDAFRKGQ